MGKNRHRIKGYESTLKWLQDLNAKRNAETLDYLIREAKLYALYLRSYALENRKNVRAVELQIVSELRRYLPTFCLLNPQYPYDDLAPRLNNEVFVSAGMWFSTFTRYASKATLVVAHVEIATENLGFELHWLVDSGQAQKKTLLLFTDNAVEGLNRDNVEVVRVSRWTQHLPPLGVRERSLFCPTLPVELKDYLARHGAAHGRG